MLWLYRLLFLYAFVRRTDAEFVPACYVDRSADVVSTGDKPHQLVEVNLTIPLGVPALSAVSYLVPKNECALDIYFHGPFWLFDVSFAMVEVKCTPLTSGFAKPEVFKVKTGPKAPDPRYPDVPPRWWPLKTTLLLIRVPTVAAGRPGVFRCEAIHVTVKSGLAVNVTVDVNGCPTGKWGKNCDRDCECVNGGTCHSWDGSCRCPKAWKGSTCHLENPHVEAEVNQTKVYIADHSRIECFPYSIDAHERNVTWRLNGSKILEGSWSLDIPSLNDSDTGTYTCEVLDNAGEIFRHSVDIKVLGCRPGWRGEGCKVPCQDCLNNGTCDRFLGCVCGEGWEGGRCEQPVCSSNVHPQLCKEGGVIPDHSTTIGWAVGGGIMLLVAVVVVTIVICYRRPCQQITITMESHLHAEYFKSKEVGDLVRHKTRLVSEDLGILLAHWEMEESMLYIGKQLDEGSFSSVSAGHVLRDNTLYSVAVKVLKDEKDSVAWANFVGEFRILSHVCPHQNIVQLVGLCTKSVLNQEVTCLVLEQLATGSLHKVLRDNRKPELCDNILAPKHYVHIVLDIIRGMAHLEELRFVHRDLATRNILLTESLVAKVSDFGLARDAYSTGDYRLEGARGKKLPWKWMAFESLKDGLYTNKSDIWSFGVLLWEVTTLGASPYPGVSNEELLSHLETGKRLERPSNCSRMWYAAMKTCWLEDPDDRPSFKDLLPFFRDHFLLPEAVSPFADNFETEDVMFESLPNLPNLLDKKPQESGSISLAEDGDTIRQRGRQALDEPATSGQDVSNKGLNLSTDSVNITMKASVLQKNSDEIKWRNSVA